MVEHLLASVAQQPEQQTSRLVVAVVVTSPLVRKYTQLYTNHTLPLIDMSVYHTREINQSINQFNNEMAERISIRMQIQCKIK